MCGFVGFCSEDMPGAEKERITREMTDIIKHRGPDEIGYFGDGRIALGFARLQIIDREGGSQPMISRDGRYVLCFNGEIYNYKELRRELGVRSYTESDTEVLLNALIKWGTGALLRLRGMFSFAFYDRMSGRLILARDPFGIKPLYYGEFDGCFMFASEIKAFTSHPKFVKCFDQAALPLYLQLQYVPTEETAFLGVKRLLPGRILIRQGDHSHTERYFELPTHFGSHYASDGTLRKVERSKARTAKNILCAVKGSVEAHSVADTEVGAFLSGGVDSGLVCSCLRPKKTFVASFTGHGFDESAYAEERANAIGASLTAVTVGADEFFDSIRDVQYYSDEPCGNLSAVPLFLLSMEASKQVRVVLSGEGADELFGGYELYRKDIRSKLLSLVPRWVGEKMPNGRLKRAVKRARLGKSFVGQARITDENGALSLLCPDKKAYLSPKSLTSPLFKSYGRASSLRKRMLLDLEMWMPYDILNKADKMTMASSLELRVPYLDKEVFKVAQGCSDRLLVRGKTTKYALRTAASEEIGKEAAFRKKKGFPVPLRDWLRQKKYARILEIAFTGAIAREFFDTDLLLRLLSEHFEGRSDNTRVLYTVYAFITWYEVYFGQKEEIK